jgi:signal transduction histidine kinase
MRGGPSRLDGLGQKESGVTDAEADLHPRFDRLLAYARELQRAASYEDLLLVTEGELRRSTGYNDAWLWLADRGSPGMVRLIDLAGSRRDTPWDAAPMLPIGGDWLLEQLFAASTPVVVEDARAHPRRLEYPPQRRDRCTSVSLPLCLLDKPFGALETGTTAEQGCCMPNAEELEYLVGIAQELAVATHRICLLDERERAERKLRQKQERQRQAHELEGMARVAGSVAHDFNNLLSVILSYSEVLLREPDVKAVIREDIQTIQAAAQRAAELTRRLLTFSRQQPVNPQVLDLNAVLSASEPTLMSVLNANIELVTRRTPAFCWVKADSAQLAQLVMSLALNARDAMPAGGKLTIETKSVQLDAALEERDVAPGAYAVLSVSDTGIGMDPRTRARIFEPFFSTKQPGKGAGLGLTTVFAIVQQSGGNIWVDSEPGCGTTFEVYFPEAPDGPQPAAAT